MCVNTLRNKIDLLQGLGSKYFRQGKVTLKEALQIMHEGISEKSIQEGIDLRRGRLLKHALRTFPYLQRISWQQLECLPSSIIAQIEEGNLPLIIAVYADRRHIYGDALRALCEHAQEQARQGGPNALDSGTWYRSVDDLLAGLPTIPWEERNLLEIMDPRHREEYVLARFPEFFA